ncbi:MAG: FAD:protein FMN transferase [Chloroflexota bacterium]
MSGTAPALTERAFRAMGTRVVVMAPADRPDSLELVRAVFQAWDARFTRFSPTSELAQLNAAAGRPHPAGPEMRGVLHAALDAARATGGTFDPLLGARMVALGYDRTFDDLPADGATPPLPVWQPGAWREVEIDDIRGLVHIPSGSAVDLGGIAKGMAVDAAIAALDAAGCPFAAVSAGGDLAVLGTPPGASGWPVILDEANERAVTIHRGALATSSVLARRWTAGGAPRHHLLDPRTGLPSTGEVVTASVAAATCREAEVGAKVALLRGAAEGAAFLTGHGLAGLLVTADGATWRTGAWSIGP